MWLFGNMVIWLFGYLVICDRICKKGLIHASNSSTLRMCNLASTKLTALKFDNRTLLSLY